MIQSTQQHKKACPPGSPCKNHKCTLCLKVVSSSGAIDSYTFFICDRLRKVAEVSITLISKMTCKELEKWVKAQFSIEDSEQLMYQLNGKYLLGKVQLETKNLGQLILEVKSQHHQSLNRTYYSK